MAKLSEHIQTSDWKKEKHVPVIECPDNVKADELFEVKVTIGKEVAHPNKTEHHIRWIGLYYLEDGGKSNSALMVHRLRGPIRGRFIRIMERRLI